MPDDPYARPSDQDIRAQARRLAEGTPVQDGGRGVDPWARTDSPDRAWADGTPNVFNRADPAAWDENALPRELQPITGLRDVRPPPSPPPQPRMDLVWEPGSMAEFNSLPAGDGDQALWRIQSLVYDLPESRGTLVGDPEKIGGSWYEATFALTSRQPAATARDDFQRRLRLSLPVGRRNDVVPAIGIEAELRALPTSELKRSAHAAMAALAMNGPADDERAMRIAGTDIDVRTRAIGDGHDLVYRRLAPVWSDQRPTIELVAVSSDSENLAEVIADRVRPRAEGRVVYRILNSANSPTALPAVQVLTVQAADRRDDEDIAERVAALKDRTRQHQRRHGLDAPLRYSVEGAQVVPVSGKAAARLNGQASAPSPAVTTKGEVKGLEQVMARWLPPDRACDLVFSEKVVAELRGLPQDTKSLVAAQLKDLAVSGPSAYDVKRRTSTDPVPGDNIAKDFDLSGLRPRYVGPTPNAPTHQIIYRYVGPQITPPRAVHVPAGRPEWTKEGAPVAGDTVRGTHDSRPSIHVIAVLRHPEPDAVRVVAERLPRRARAWQQDLTGSNRRLSDGPTIIEAKQERPQLESAEQLAERLAEKPPSRAKAAALRSTTTPDIAAWTRAAAAQRPTLGEAPKARRTHTSRRGL